MVDNQVNEFNPDYIVAPGETIQDLLEYHCMSQADLAVRTCKTPKTVNEIIKGKAPITYDTALQLERVFNVPADFWNNLEGNYRQLIAKKKEEKELQEQIDFLKRFPLKFMVKNDWITEYKSEIEQLKELLTFFGVSSLESWKKVWEDTLSQPDAAFRQTEKFTVNPESVAVWLRKGELEAKKIVCEDYNEAKFKNSISQIRKMTNESPEVFIPKLKKICADAGVMVIFIPQTPAYRVSGATTWIGKKPLIQLSLRYKSNDHLWFTFFHEVGHILKHGRKQIFLEYKDNKNEWETEADNFASETLIPKSAYDNFVSDKKFTKDAILKFAKMIEIAPGCVVGRLQHDKLVSYQTKLNYLKKSYKWK